MEENRELTELEIRKELALEKVNEKRLQLNRVVSFINQEKRVSKF